MKEQFLPYNLALKLKELGFEEDCLATYWKDGEFSRNPSHNMEDLPIEGQPYMWANSKIHVDNCTAPLWQQAFDWFREKYELHSCILVLSKLKWAYVITNFTDYVDSDTQILKAFETYEEAREACLLKLIELCGKN